MESRDKSISVQYNTIFVCLCDKISKAAETTKLDILKSFKSIILSKMRGSLFLFVIYWQKIFFLLLKNLFFWNCQITYSKKSRWPFWPQLDCDDCCAPAAARCAPAVRVGRALEDTRRGLQHGGLEGSIRRRGEDHPHIQVVINKSWILNKYLVYYWIFQTQLRKFIWIRVFVLF